MYAIEAITFAERTHHGFTIALAYFAAGTLQLLKSDWARARSLIEHWVGVARLGQADLTLPCAVASLAWILAQLGEASEALDRLEEGKQLLEGHISRGNWVGHGAWVPHALGRACLALGRLDEARHLGDRSAQLSLGHHGFAAHASLLNGDIATHHDRFDAASAHIHYRQALGLAEPRGMRPLVAHSHLGLGKLYRRTGDAPKAQEHLTTAATMYREMGMGFYLTQAERVGRDCHD